MLDFFKKGRNERKFIWLVYVEIATRFGWMWTTAGGSINFSEFINNCHPFIEALRSCLRTHCSSASSKDVIALTQEIGAFLDKWTAAYTGWLSDFKSRSPNAKVIVRRSNEWMYEEIQTFYGNSTELYDDITLLLGKIKKVSNNFEAKLEKE